MARNVNVQKGKQGFQPSTAGAQEPTAARQVAQQQQVVTGPSEDVTRAEAWERYQRTREEQGLGKNSLAPNESNDRYSLANKRTSDGRTYYTAHIKATGQIEEFGTGTEAAKFAETMTGSPLASDSRGGFRAGLERADKWGVYSDGDGRGGAAVLEHHDEETGVTYSVYRYKDAASPTRETWRADITAPDALIGSQRYQFERVWEGDGAPSLTDLTYAYDHHRNPDA